jgi:alpha-beta hydrolase superfamily lysophospholipase
MKLLFLLFLVSCSNVFYQPSRVLYADPKKFVNEVDVVWFKSNDGTKLNAWWMPSTKIKPKGTIVFFHGNAENLSSHFLNLAWITHEGYNLFIFDYRGYGASEGSPNPSGIYEDSFAALDKGFELHQKFSPKEKFIVYGQSLGGVIALRALADWRFSNDIDLLVQDSTFMSYKDLAFDKLNSFWLTFLISPLAFVLISDKFSSDQVIDKIKIPMLVISGDKDYIIPLKFTKEIYKNSKSKKKWFWQIENGIHGDVFAYHDFKYRKKFLELLNNL